MGINGVSLYANTYTYGNVKNENVKPSKNSEKNYYAGYTMNSANKFKNVSDYSKYLTNKYKCLTPCKNASVLIDRSVMQKACGDEKTAKWLEENLAIMPDVIPVSYTHLFLFQRILSEPDCRLHLLHRSGSTISFLFFLQILLP